MRGALLPTLWLLPLLAAAQPAPPQVPASAGEVAGRPAAATDPRLPLLAEMAAELQRNRQALRLEGYDAPYFISYQVGEVHRRVLGARFGALDADATVHSRGAHVEVRVGDYQLDSAGVDATDYERYVAYQPSEELPLEDDPAALRGALWLLTERKYKEAIASLLKKKAKGVYTAKKNEVPDFSKESPTTHLDAPLRLTIDEARWKPLLRDIARQICHRTEVFDSSVKLVAEHQRRWQVNTEGSRILTERTLYSLHVVAYTRAEDGMLLDNERMFYASRDDRLPDATHLAQEVEELLTELLLLRQAPLLDPYVGPAIFEPEAAGVLFHEAVGHRLEGQRQKDNSNEGQTFKGRIGERILPTFLDVRDDPTLTAAAGEELNGFYRIDEEGVPAQRVTLVEQGVLRGFLMSRTPIEGQERSNGHGRAQLGYAPVGRMGNLIIGSSRQVAPPQLAQRLLAEVRRQKKPYGLIIGDLAGGSTNTSTFGYQAFKGSSRLVWKVDAQTGARTLVRGVEIVGTPLTSVNKILVTSSELGVFNGFCGAESGAVPVSVIAPAVLIEEIELQRASRDEDRGPLLPPPWREEPELLRR